MRKLFALLLALTGWIAVVSQYFLMLDNSAFSIAETTIRFFSYFTILTNLIVAIYFICLILPAGNRPALIGTPGTLTAITCYITMVGLIYQVVLRPLWHPEGPQWLVNELLHTVIPLAVILFWYFYKDLPPLPFRKIGGWLVYPLLYLIYILIRGNYSQFYPYPFVDVSALGMSKVLLNAGLILVLFILISALFIFINSRSSRL